jgi:recombination protein RecA
MAGIDRAGGKAGDRDKALETALAQIERQFGRGSIMRLGDEARAPIEVIPTGAISLDIALGIGGHPRGRIVEIYGPEGSGKALALDTPIPTPKGWTTMGELSPGEEVFAGDGSPTRVTFATPVMTGHECFRVRFSDGAEVIADADHQWVTENEEERRERRATQSCGVRTTRQIAATLRVGRQANHAIRTTQPFRLPDTELPLDPYVLGLWLGAGGSHGDTFTTADPELLEAFHWAAFPTTAQSKRYVYYVKGLKDALRPLGVLRNKHVPAQYLRGSEEQRRALLAGLLDTDGSIRHGAGLIRFVNTNEALIDGVRELVHSLGLTTRVSVREAGTYGPDQRRCWTVVFTPDSEAGEFFRLRRKQGHRQLTDAGRARRRYITAVEPVASVPVRCIQVDHPSHTYLAGHECIPTHNTTVALHAAASAQKNGGIAAFIDAEHALDPEYAKKLGVDTDALLVSQPDTGEQALEIADMLVRSSAIDVIIIDSVAALVPRAEIEGEMGDSHVGLQARLMSQAMRKLAGALNQTRTTAIFINQLREKVGVMFGCMCYSTRVTLADGTQEKIGKIVNQRRDVEVLSYDPETNRVVPRRIVNWFNNGRAERFLQFTVAKSGKNGRAQFAATENHLIRTPGGWRPAGELLPGDRVIVAEQQLLGGQQVQVILGSLMGDGGLSPNLRGRSGTRFRVGHGAQQEAYLDWKVSLLENIPHSRTSNAKGAVFADFGPLPELGELREIVYFGDGKKHITWDYLKSLTPLALAVWYMDDGCFTLRSKGVQERTRGGTGRIEICVEAMSPGSRERLVSHLRDAYRLDVKLTIRGAQKKSVLQFTTAASEDFQRLVAPYVHPSMDYKLLPRFRGRFAVQPEFAPAKTRPVPAQVLDVHIKPRTRSMSRFDIEVEGSHCYFVDGVMVHNSPETTSGGRALKFYASVRLDVRRIETLKDGTDAVGSRTKVKVVKNKLAAPFRTAEFDILFGLGISREGGLIDLGVEQGIVRKSGAWYTYEGDQLGQGKENARNFLRDNPDTANEIEKKIKEKLGVGPRLDAEVMDKEQTAGAGGLRAVPNPAASAAGATNGRGVTRLTGEPGGAG